VTDSPAPLSPAARRAVIGLGLTQIIAWGSLYYAIGVLGPTLAQALELSATAIYGGYSLSLAAGALLAPAIGRAIDRHGGRRVMTAGSAVAALGLALAAQAQGAASYFLACVVLGVGVGATLYDAAFAALTQIAGRRARRAITLLTLFGGFASTVFWPLTSWLLTLTGWREIFWLYAGAHLLACLPAHWLLLADEPDQAAFAAPAESALAERDGALRGRSRRAAFWLFALALTAQSFAFAGLAAHLMPVLGGVGLDARAAVIVGMAIGPAQVLARLIEMLSGTRHDALSVARTSAVLLLVGVGCLALAKAMHPAAAFAFALAYGLGNGLSTIAKGAVTLHLFGSARYGRTLGELSAPSLAARSAAPTVFSLINASQGLGATLALCLALSAVGLAATEMLVRIGRRGG
jgi:MFS family permease